MIQSPPRNYDEVSIPFENLRTPLVTLASSLMNYFLHKSKRKQGVERDAFKEKTFPYPPRQIVYSLNKVLQPPTKLIHSLVEHLPIP